MRLKKCLETGKKGQSIMEYILLVVIAVLAIIAVNFVQSSKNGAFTDQLFETTAHYIASEAF